MRTIFKRVALVLAVGLSVPATEAANVSTTMRVEHGQPVVLVSQKAVLWLEFLPDSRAAVSQPEPDVRSCRAHYRYQLFDAATGIITNGQGTVEEILKVVGRTSTVASKWKTAAVARASMRASSISGGVKEQPAREAGFTIGQSHRFALSNSRGK